MTRTQFLNRKTKSELVEYTLTLEKTANYAWKKRDELKGLLEETDAHVTTIEKLLDKCRKHRDRLLDERNELKAELDKMAASLRKANNGAISDNVIIARLAREYPGGA